MSVTLTSSNKNDLDLKKIFSKIMLIYVNLLCIKSHSLKVTDRAKPRVRNSPIMYDLFVLKNSKILKKLLKGAKSKKL